MYANYFLMPKKGIICREECPFYHDVPEEFRDKSENFNDYRGCSYKNIVEQVEYIEATLPGMICHHPSVFENRGLIHKLFGLVSKE